MPTGGTFVGGLVGGGGAATGTTAAVNTAVIDAAGTAPKLIVIATEPASVRSGNARSASPLSSAD